MPGGWRAKQKGRERAGSSLTVAGVNVKLAPQAAVRVKVKLAPQIARVNMKLAPQVASHLLHLCRIAPPPEPGRPRPN